MEKKYIKSVNKIFVEDGVYHGLYGGWEVYLNLYGMYFKVDMGVRGINIPVLVTVKDGEAIVEIKKES